MPTGGRKTQLQLIHEISASFGPTSGATGLIGVLPVGAVINQLHSVISAAFNSTTNTGAFGLTPGGTELQNGISMLAPVRTDSAPGFALIGPFAVNTPIYWSQVFTGAPPTTGLATFWVEYLPGVG